MNRIPVEKSLWKWFLSWALADLAPPLLIYAGLQIIFQVAALRSYLQGFSG